MVTLFLFPLPHNAVSPNHNVVTVDTGFETISKTNLNFSNCFYSCLQ